MIITLHDKLVYTVRPDLRSCLHRTSSKQHNAKAIANSFMSLPHNLFLCQSTTDNSTAFTFNVTFRGIHVHDTKQARQCTVQIRYHTGAFVQPLLLRESHEYYIWRVFVSLSYPACNAHAPYCHLWPVRLYTIFPQFFINVTIFENNLQHTKCVF